MPHVHRVMYSAVSLGLLLFTTEALARSENRRPDLKATIKVSSSNLDFSELKLGPVSTEKLELNDEGDDSDASDENKNGKSAKKICDDKCQADKAAVEERMKQLRDMINSDFDNMVDFGKKVGYLPPPRSIEQQVMDGTLLGGDGETGADAKAPPAFTGNSLIRNLPLATKPLQVHASDSKPAAQRVPAEESGAVDGGGDSGVSDDAPLASDPADASADIPADASADVSVDSGSQRAAYRGAGAGDAGGSIADDDAVDMAAGDDKDVPAWDKAFAFMKDTDNPILGGGGAKTRSEAAAGGGGGGDGGERAAAEMGIARASGDSDDGAPDPLRSDKFLKGFFGR